MAADYALGFYICRAFIFDQCCPDFEELVHESDRAVVVEEAGVTYFV
jgi:hypothetical protein